MAQEISIKRQCPFCAGTGEFLTSTGPDGQVISCPYPECNATGYTIRDTFVLDPGTDELLTKLNDIADKWDTIVLGYQTIINKLNQILQAI